MNIQKIMSSLEAKHPGESEYLQAVKEVLLSIEDIYNQHPEFEKAKIIERLVEPDRIFTFRVTWVDEDVYKRQTTASSSIIKLVILASELSLPVNLRPTKVAFTF